MVWGTDSKSDESFSGEETTRTHITKRFVGGLSNPHCMKPHSPCTPFSPILTVQPFSLCVTALTTTPILSVSLQRTTPHNSSHSRHRVRLDVQSISY
jgi:hypothetical protein